jgi:hypothetical protein
LRFFGNACHSIYSALHPDTGASNCIVLGVRKHDPKMVLEQFARTHIGHCTVQSSSMLVLGIAYIWSLWTQTAFPGCRDTNIAFSDFQEAVF